MKILDDVCEVITCGVAKRPEYVSSGIPFLSSKNVKKDRFILDHYNFISENDYQQLTKHNKPQKGDILYTRVGSFGEAAVVDFDFKFAVFVSLTLIKPKHENVHARYLMHYLNSPNIVNLANNSTSGIGVQNLNVNVVRKFPINLPPLPEQQKITSILDAADELKQNDKKLIAKYDALTQALFLDMFGDPVSNPKGWERLKLGLVTNMKAGKFISASEIYSENDKNLFLCYGGNGIRGFAKSYTHEGDFVLIGRQGALCGNVKVANGRFHATEHAIVCSPKMKYETLWLYYLLDIINLNRYATGAAQPGLNVSKLVELGIIFAPYDLQNQFAKSVALIEEQKAIAQKSLEKSENLFNSLLQKAFNGELV